MSILKTHVLRLYYSDIPLLERLEKLGSWEAGNLESWKAGILGTWEVGKPKNQKVKRLL
ncbi:MAG: hypothetical protein NZ531_00590 [Aquificaceae bacterium]|nr:hypothetical protein [Aquificaceae bacterium]